MPTESVLVSWVSIFLTSPSLLCFNFHAMGIYHTEEKKFRDNLSEKTVIEVLVNKHNTKIERKYIIIFLVVMCVCVNNSLGR